MFAAVMRKAGVPKQLECHGFVCDSPEEAILVAANLYQALLETMKRNKRPNNLSQVRDKSRTPPVPGACARYKMSEGQSRESFVTELIIVWKCFVNLTKPGVVILEKIKGQGVTEKPQLYTSRSRMVDPEAI